MGSWYLPTNRHNLLAMWSGGLLCGPPNLEKYRSDLLEEAPGRLVLIDGPAPGAVVDRISDEETQSYPVMIELELGEGCTITPVGHLGPAQVAAPTGVAPTDTVRRVHLQADRHQREIAARSYSNIAAGDLPLVVTPELFDDESDPAEFKTLVETLNALPATGPGPGLRRGLDAMCGALTMACTTAPADEGMFNWLAGTLTGLTTADTDPLRSATGLLASAGLERRGSDTALLGAAIDLLVERGPGVPPVGTDFIAELADRVPPDPAMEKGLNRIRDVLRGRAEFERFNDPTSAPVLKALLLFLTRPDPSEVVTWTSETTGSHPGIIVLGAFFTGFAAGLSRIPLDLRGSPELQHFLVVAAADALNRVASSPLPAFTTGGVEVDVEGGNGGEILTLRSARGALLGPLTVAVEPPEVLEGAPAAEEPTAPPAEFDDPTAVRIARSLGWDECVRITVTAVDATLTSSGRRVVATFPGDAVVTEEVDRERFNGRITGADPDAVSAAAAAPEAVGSRPARKRRPAAPRKKAAAQPTLSSADEVTTSDGPPDGG